MKISLFLIVLLTLTPLMILGCDKPLLNDFKPGEIAQLSERAKELVMSYPTVEAVSYSEIEGYCCIIDINSEIEGYDYIIDIDDSKYNVIIKDVKIVRVSREPDQPQKSNDNENETYTFYYKPSVEQQYGIRNLEDCLSRWYWKPGTYEANVFDCTEMSALLEWLLENEGFHTLIVSGRRPETGEGYHAWLLVETSKGEYTPVEATWFTIIYPECHYYENYFKYEHRFETIHEALEQAPEQYNWWKQ